METPTQMCARLVTALEDLVAQEAVCLQTRNFAAVVSIQDRALPLIELLVAHAADVLDPQLRERISAIIERRHETGAWLTAELERTRMELHAVQAGQRRAAQVAPVYGGRNTAPRSTLSVIG